MGKSARQYLGPLVLCGMLAACGGASDPEPVASRPMMVTLDLISVAQAREITAGAQASIDMNGTLQRIDIGPFPVYLDVHDALGVFAPTTQAGPTNNLFKVSVPIAPNVTPGSYVGTLVMRACIDPACKTVYAGNTVSLAYTLKVNAPG